MTDPERDAAYFAALLREMDPAEVTRFTEWMAAQIAEMKVKGASA